MPVTSIWTRFGGAIEAEPEFTLRAFLDDEKAIAILGRRNLKTPTFEDFARDSAFEPNPSGLDLPEEYLETMLLVHALSTWGRPALVRAAGACSNLQCLNQSECDPRLTQLRDDTNEAVGAFLRSESGNNLLRVQAFSTMCYAAYAPYENDPDCEMAVRTWTQLGAPWFAAETIAQDWGLQPYDGHGPACSQSTWCRRNSEWPKRAADAAANCTTEKVVRDAIRKALLG
ncbi:MAG TPA: hypothetical protein P5081_03865 [Phycisphaerae bacterium]|nr:hypothetical protein [Phycisphaerae bacterium]